MIQGLRPIKLILGNAESTSLCDERQRLGRLFVVGSLGPGWVFAGLHDVRSLCAPTANTMAGFSTTIVRVVER